MSQEPPRPFDRRHASTYDKEFAKLSPFKDALHIVMRSALAGLPDNARILCVGAGTGAEVIYLAEQFPGSHITALDLSEPMLDVCRTKVEKQGLSGRCEIHLGDVASLQDKSFDAATCILVSQFLVNLNDRRSLFQDIRARLGPGDRLVSADLACDLTAPESARSLEIWGNTLAFNGGSAEQIEKALAGLGKAVSVLPERQLEGLIESAGFEPPLHVFQTGLIHAWVTRARETPQGRG